MLSSPNYTENFDILTDVYGYQMGVVVMQSKQPFVFFSCKLNPTQSKYTTTEQELLVNVENLKQFQIMLLGQRVTVHTNHKNLIHLSTEFSFNRFLRQQLTLRNA